MALIRRRRTQALIDSLTGEIATAARHAARCRIEGGYQGMSLNMLRGYVRARAALPIRDQMRARARALAGVPPVARESIRRMSTERAVHLVVRDLAGLEISHTARRKAA